MQIEATEQWVGVFEALASRPRLRILALLARRPMNIRELAEALGLSSAIVSAHVRRLEEAGIIRSERGARNGASQKLCRMDMESLQVRFPDGAVPGRRFHSVSLPVGHYTDFRIRPTCGLATRAHIIGRFDDPHSFLDAERADAGILWFSEGYVEYTVPNYLAPGEIPTELYISLELGSEAPSVNSVWPSDITFTLNQVPIGTWTSPGDFGGIRGRYTPEWWRLNVNQFGSCKLLRIDRTGSYVDGMRISDMTIDRLDIRRKHWKFRLSVPKSTDSSGGLTLFGRGFGNYDQDIEFSLYYT